MISNDRLSDGSAAFKPGVQEVEFKVRVGFTPLKSRNGLPHHSSHQKRSDKEWQTQNCKIVCKQGEWIGPLCRGSNGKILNSYEIILPLRLIDFSLRV